MAKSQSLSIVRPNLAAVGISSMLYGMFVLLTLMSVYLHVSRGLKATAPYGRVRLAGLFTPILVGTLVIFCSCTGHWILIFIRVFQAFVIIEGGKAPESFYSNLSETTLVVKTAMIVVTLVTADIVIAYRLWVVWNRRSYMVIIPAMSIVGLCVCGFGAVYQFAHVPDGKSVFVSNLAQWITADYAFTFSTNVYCSAMISYKVWITSKRSGKVFGGDNLIRVLVTIIESAAIYTVWVAVFFATYEAGSNMEYTFVDTLPQVAGIAFMMINVRVGLGWAAQGSSAPLSSGARFQCNPDQRSFAMRPVAVDISTTVQRYDGIDQPIKYDGSDVQHSNRV